MAGSTLPPRRVVVLRQLWAETFSGLRSRKRRTLYGNHLPQASFQGRSVQDEKYGGADGI